MPEGDSVFQLARRLQFMTGREVTYCSLRVPRLATVDFTGTVCRRVWPYGKHLFMLFDQDVLHTHLKMEGTWAIHRAGQRWKKPGFSARVVLRLSCDAGADIEVVGHHLGLVEAFPARQWRSRMNYLGPDVLGADWADHGRAEARRRLAARPERPVGTAILDQKNLAGVGNEYRAEICFLLGVHPATPIGAVDLDRLLALAHRLMRANRDSPIRVTTGVRRAGESSYVFGRAGKPCRRCGTPIASGWLGGAHPAGARRAVPAPRQPGGAANAAGAIAVDARGRPRIPGDPTELERVIWWCPSCQPLAAGR